MKSFWTYCGTANVDIMSLQNEPNWVPTNYEGCQWTAQNFLDFCKTYAPQIGKPIMMPESMNYDFSFSDPTLNDATAAANVTYIGGHLYGASPKVYTLATSKGKHVWETEHYLTGDDASTCMTFAKEVFDCMNCNFSAYVWWWMTYNTGDGLWTGSAPNHRAWVLGQFSKWVRPGFVRVDATYAPQAGVNVVAFKGTNYVIVAENSNTTSQSVTFTCSNATIPSVNKYTSSQTKNGASDGLITATANSFTTNLDAQSVTTFVSTNNVSIMSPYKGVEKPYGIGAQTNAAAHFVYLINGKRFSLQGMNEQGNPTPGIYVMPGKAQVSVGSEKLLQNSKK
jgi:glucuronoarabinoxylan endo-1,4-beta-xylanase